VGAKSPADAKTWTYPDVTQGPYVWHCHINSHEDSEMMRTSLVVK
jgi:FtsP/CotA-like multicopper oxidase with cupredoxin domain